jgi:hypothetical protein
MHACAQDIDMTERMEAAPKQRISIYCIAESLDRKLLQKKLEARGPRFLVKQYPDVLYGQYISLESGAPLGDMCARMALSPASCMHLICVQVMPYLLRQEGASTCYQARYVHNSVSILLSEERLRDIFSCVAPCADSTSTTAACPSGT